MKKAILPLVIAIALTGAVSAQGFSGYGPGPGRGPGFEPMARSQANLPTAPVIETIEGKLELVNGSPAIKDGALTYYVRLPGMLYGFIDGFKEGAQVKLEGYKFAIPSVKDSFVFHVEKLTLGSRVIDLSAKAMAGLGMQEGMMGGMMGQGSGFGGMHGRY